MGKEDDDLTVENPKFEMIPHWVMDHEKVTGNAVRVYLILRRYSDANNRSFPSRRRVARDLGVAVATIDSAIDVLVSIGALTVTARWAASGDQTSNLYTLHWYINEQGGLISIPPPIRKLDDPLYENREANSYSLNQDLVNQDAATPPNATVIAQRLAKGYATKVPLSKFTAIMGICKKALAANYTEEQITIALDQLAEEGRPVTVDTLRIQMEGLPTSSGRESNLQRKRKQQADVLRKYSNNGREIG